TRRPAQGTWPLYRKGPLLGRSRRRAQGVGRADGGNGHAEELICGRARLPPSRAAQQELRPRVLLLRTGVLPTVHEIQTTDRPVATSEKPPRSANGTPIGELLDRQPPRSIEAERAIIGSLLLLPEACDEVALVVRPEDFYHDAHRVIFGHMMALH